MHHNSPDALELETLNFTCRLFLIYNVDKYKLKGLNTENTINIQRFKIFCLKVRKHIKHILLIFEHTTTTPLFETHTTIWNTDI